MNFPLLSLYRLENGDRVRRGSSHFDEGLKIGAEKLDLPYTLSIIIRVTVKTLISVAANFWNNI